ncbi:hypothetical protein ES702_01799 [subsurface metagenome]
MSVEERLSRIEKILEKYDVRLDTINKELGQLIGESNTMNKLIKWVITPLLFILAALIGIKLRWPT